MGQHLKKYIRKNLLIVDNCTALIEVSMLAIRMVILPPYVPLVLQPMDQRVILSFKRNHRRLLLLKTIILNSELENHYDVGVLCAFMSFRMEGCFTKDKCKLVSACMFQERRNN